MKPIFIPILRRGENLHLNRFRKCLKKVKLKDPVSCMPNGGFGRSIRFQTILRNSKKLKDACEVRHKRYLQKKEVLMTKMKRKTRKSLMKNLVLNNWKWNEENFWV